MKDVRAVLVGVDPFDALGADVADDVRALVNDEDGFALFLSFVGKNGVVQADADCQKIIIHMSDVPIFQFSVQRHSLQ